MASQAFVSIWYVCSIHALISNTSKIFCDIVDTTWHGHFAAWLVSSPPKWYFSFFCSKYFETCSDPFCSFFRISSVLLICPNVSNKFALSLGDVSLELAHDLLFPLTLKLWGLFGAFVDLLNGGDGSGACIGTSLIFVKVCWWFSSAAIVDGMHTNAHLLSLNWLISTCYLTSQPCLTWPQQLLTPLTHFYGLQGPFYMSCPSILNIALSFWQQTCFPCFQDIFCCIQHYLQHFGGLDSPWYLSTPSAHLTLPFLTGYQS